jgi:hypothetical protein
MGAGDVMNRGPSRGAFAFVRNGVKCVFRVRYTIGEGLIERRSELDRSQPAQVWIARSGKPEQ